MTKMKTKIRQAAMLAVVCCLTAGQTGAQAEPDLPALSEAEQKDLHLLTGQLSDPTRVAKTKLEAAQQLLSRSYPQAAEALKGFLEANDNRPAQIAVAEAIALRGGKERAFIKPLVAMLTGVEPSVRAPAARALATYKNHGVRVQLMDLVRAPKTDRAARLEIITILQSMLDKQAVVTLIDLLDDADAAIRDAADAALTKLTSFRTFGDDPAREWKQWWQLNKDKSPAVWLADRAESLGRAKAALDAENTKLRQRLVKALQDLYTTTPSARRDAALLGYLKDSLAEVRLAGLELTNRRVRGEKKPPSELKQQVLALLADEDVGIRRSAALLVANLGDEKASEALLARLGVENSRPVREGLLIALGQLRDPVAIPAVLKEIHSKYEDVAAAASLALARIASKNPLSDEHRDQATKALVDRYRQNGHSPGGSILREALLIAMGVVPGKAVTAVLLDALKDKAAVVRLAAVDALGGLGQAPLAKSLVPLTGDTDRGVRQAAIAALGKLDAAAHLQTILERTRPSIEADLAVRKQAWDVIHQQEKPTVLAAVWKDLTERDDVLEHRIKVGQKLAAGMAAAKDPKLASFQRELASVLMAAMRPAKAAAMLREAHAALKQADSPDTQGVWLEWVTALLAAGDPESINVVASQTSAEAFAQATKALKARVTDLEKKGEFQKVIAIVSPALSQLGKRLAANDKQDLAKILAKARGKQAAADRLFVAKAIPQLVGTDAVAARVAGESLRDMGDRAVAPLVEELRKTLTAANPDPRTEKVILDMLAKIAPKLNGYDVKSNLATRLKCVEGWLKVLQPASGPV